MDEVTYPPGESSELLETLGAIYVQLTRLYDAVMLQGLLMHEDEFVELMKSHEQGDVLSSPPVIGSYGSDVEDEVPAVDDRSGGVS